MGSPASEKVKARGASTFQSSWGMKDASAGTGCAASTSSLLDTVMLMGADWFLVGGRFLAKSEMMIRSLAVKELFTIPDTVLSDAPGVGSAGHKLVFSREGSMACGARAGGVAFWYKFGGAWTIPRSAGIHE